MINIRVFKCYQKSFIKSLILNQNMVTKGECTVQVALLNKGWLNDATDCFNS